MVQAEQAVQSVGSLHVEWERERERVLCDDILNGNRFAFGVFITNVKQKENVFSF